MVTGPELFVLICSKWHSGLLVECFWNRSIYCYKIAEWSFDLSEKINLAHFKILKIFMCFYFVQSSNLLEGCGPPFEDAFISFFKNALPRLYKTSLVVLRIIKSSPRILIILIVSYLNLANDIN